VNYILTYECAKGCEYCFAKKARDEMAGSPDINMSEEDYINIIDKSNIEYIKMLGGEPTSHPKFNRFLDIAYEKKKRVTLITNMLFGDDVLNHIVYHINEGHTITFLINTTDIDKKDRKERWSKNYKTIFQELYKFDLEESISCGITLEEDKDIDYYDKYLDFIIENIHKIEKLRIALPFQGGENKDPLKIIQNKDWGNKLIFVINKCVSLGILPTIDEILYPCIFENKEHAKYVRKFSQNGDKYKCNGAPFDIFPDKKVSYCYPLKDKVVIDMNDFINYGEAKEAMMTQYKIQYEEAKHKIPTVCKECVFFGNMCDGPCLGLLI